MLKLQIIIQDKDEHKLITHLEHIQWDIAGGEKSGNGWTLEEIKDENQGSNSKT